LQAAARSFGLALQLDRSRPFPGSPKVFSMPAAPSGEEFAPVVVNPVELGGIDREPRLQLPASVPGVHHERVGGAVRAPLRTDLARPWLLNGTGA